LRNSTNNIKEYIQLTHPRLIKQYLWGWLIMINLFGIPTAIYGFLNSYTKVFLIPIIIINIWIFYLMIGVEKKQKVYVLFIGVFSLLISFILMVASFKIVEPINGFLLEEYIIISIFFYIAIIVFGSMYHIRAVKNGYYFKGNTKGRKGTGFVVALSSLGLLVGRVISRNVTEEVGTIIFALCALILGYLLELGIHNLYKYYLLKRNSSC